MLPATRLGFSLPWPLRKRSKTVGGTIFTIAMRNLLQAKRRTILLGLAVAIVAALFLLLRVASATVAERMVEAATTLSSGHVNVGGFYKTRRKGADPVVN